MTPEISTPEGELPLTIFGFDLFDSPSKKARIMSEIGKKNVEINWDKNNKTMVVQALPLNQLTSDEKILNIEKIHFELFIMIFVLVLNFKLVNGLF